MIKSEKIKTTMVHFSVGECNSIPLAVCGSTHAHAIRYTRSRVDLVGCPRCRRILENCGVDIPRQALRLKAHDSTEDVIIYSLPKTRRGKVKND